VVPNNDWNYTSDDLDFNFSRATVQNATNYSWNFGDNTTSSLQNPGNKSYANPGVYNLTLIASNGCSNHTFSASVTVPFYKSLNNVPNTGFQEVIAFNAQTIYFLGTNGKLYKTDTAGNWSAPINLPSRLTFNERTRLFKDINGNLWIYGRNEVAKFNPATSTWTSSYAATGFGNNETINGIAIDNSGNLWTVGDRQIRRNNTVINSAIVNQYSSIAFAPTTGRVWITASNRNSLYYVNANSNSLNAVDGTGILNGANLIKVHPNGELFVATETGIIRTNSTGGPIANYNALTTGTALSGEPKTFDFDNEGNLWVLVNGRLVKVPLSTPANAKNYGVVPALNGISSLSVLNVAGTDNDIIISKTANNGAIRIK
jgi:ligand-binding sensor domain-containing protein